MKILSVIITSPDYTVSGAVTAALKLSEEIAKMANLELAIMSNENKIELKPIIKRKFLSKNKLKILQYIVPRQLRNAYWTSDIHKYIKKTKPDIVHIHNPVPPKALWEVANTCLKLGIPYILSSHGFIEMFDYKNSYSIGKIKALAINSLVMKPFYLSLKNASAFFILSPNEKSNLYEFLQEKPRTYIITNGYDKYYSKKANNDLKKELVTRFKINKNIPVLFYLGNHTFNKGIDILLKSSKLTSTKCQLIIGGKIRSKIKHDSLIKKYVGLYNENNICFTDFLKKKEVRAIYQIADYFIFPTRADTLPLVILDAMISGLPVISTKVGGIPYQIDESCGLLVEPESPKLLANAIDTMVKNNKNITMMRNNSMKRVKKLFNWEISAQLAIEAYKEIIAG